MFVNLKKINSFQAFGLFFLYSVFISLILQFFVLSILLPNLGTVDGLISGDMTFYHNRSVVVSENISQLGWSAWELRPQGFGIVGVVSAIYSFFNVYSPYILIPFFSALHALGALSIMKLVGRLNVEKNIAFISSVPFLIFPSAVLWYAQILKDTFTLNGSLIILYGLIGLFGILKIKELKAQLTQALLSILIIIFGFALVWLVRPYFAQLSFIFAIFALFILNVALVVLLIKGRAKISALFVIWLSQYVLYIFIQYLPYDTDIDVPKPKDQIVTNNTQPIETNNTQPVETPIEANNTQPVETPIEAPIEANNTQLVEANNDIEIFSYKKWESSEFLPHKIDAEFKKLYLQRSYFYQVQHTANSTFDYKQDLNSVEKMILYIPRAIQVAFLSPFPSSWFGNHPAVISNLMHRITGIEMMVVYVFLTGFLYSLYLWRKKIELWIMVSFSFYFALLPVYAFPNIGALVRYRYSAIMILVALGVGAYMHLYYKSKRMK